MMPLMSASWSTCRVLSYKIQTRKLQNHAGSLPVNLCRSTSPPGFHSGLTTQKFLPHTDQLQEERNERQHSEKQRKKQREILSPERDAVLASAAALSVSAASPPTDYTPVS